MHDKSQDHGASIFYRRTIRDRGTIPYATRFQIAHYLFKDSANLVRLSGFMHQLYTVRGQKLLIFCAWPLT